VWFGLVRLRNTDHIVDTIDSRAHTDDPGDIPHIDGPADAPVVGPREHSCFDDGTNPHLATMGLHVW
jgi:hypothetical protein